MNSYEVISKIYDISEEDFIRLSTKHERLTEKLILDLVNGVGVVAKDLNDSSKNIEKGFSRIWDTVSGNAKKRQNLINELTINGLIASTVWLQCHDEEITKIYSIIEKIAVKLIDVMDENKSKFNEVDNAIESLEKFRKSAEQRFEHIEETLKKIEAQQEIDIEVSKLYDLDLPIEIEIFTILDNLASGKFGLWFMFEKNARKKEEQISYLKRKIKEKIEINCNQYLDFKKLSLDINNLEPIEKKAIEFISKQYQSFKDENSYEIIELIALATTNTPDYVEYEIDKYSNIRTFMSYTNYIDVMVDEVIGEGI